MTSVSFDSNILIDSLLGIQPARDVLNATTTRGELWISRMVWIEVLSKGSGAVLKATEAFLDRFGIDEVTADIAARAAALRRDRAGLKTPDAIILATAQLRGRTLITRNIKDFPEGTPGVRIPYQLN